MKKRAIVIYMFLFSMGLAICCGTVLDAAVITLTTTNDNGPGSLRAAINTANASTENTYIIMPDGRYYLTGDPGENSNLSGDLDIYSSKMITIAGSNPADVIIDANGCDRVLDILSGTVVLINITIQGGNSLSQSGGGIYNGGDLTLDNCMIRYNTTGWIHFSPDGNGGGIYNTGSLALNGCAIYENTTGDGEYSYNGADGGNGAGIYSTNFVIMTNSTISNNVCGKGGNGFDCYGGDGGSGGGLFNKAGGTAIITSCTISHNSAGENGIYDPDGLGCMYPADGDPGQGGGIYNKGSVIIKNTILANNEVKTGGEGPDCKGSLNSQGYNLIENTGGCTLMGLATGNIKGRDPLLGPLQNNYGLTLTHALLPGSPAIDAGCSFGSIYDQRGFARPYDVTGIANADDASDIGAYEYASYLPAPSYNISGKITVDGIGLAGVFLMFSSGGGVVTTDGNGNYSSPVPYGWSGTVTPEKEGYGFTPAYRTYSHIAVNKKNQDYTAAVLPPPYISLNHTHLSFGATTGGTQTGSQTVSISNSGGYNFNWTATSGSGWLNCTPTSGTAPSVMTVSVNPTGLAKGMTSGVISLTSPTAENSPQYIQVTLTVYDTQGNLPWGTFDTPLNGSTVSGSIAVTGWALDNIGVETVKIYRNSIAGESGGLVYIGDAVFVEGARPDIESLYPDFPNNYKAGWGYLMLTNALPNQGNGVFTLYAKAVDTEGNVVTLGSKTITCDNAHAVKPFGAIDTPRQGGIASGNQYINFGWALTPLPNTITKSGTTITVWVDGVSLGHPAYNKYRQDIAALFPGYNNSDGAGGNFTLDTRTYHNGVHTISWSVKDNAGNTDGIGSRYFAIQNTGSGYSTASSASQSPQSPQNQGAFIARNSTLEVDMSQIPLEYSLPLQVKKGYRREIAPEILYPDENNNITIEIKELERIEINLGSPVDTRELVLSSKNRTPQDNLSQRYYGYLVQGDELRPLPIGSTLDAERGIFYWQPGPGFNVAYELVFIRKTEDGEMTKRQVIIKINAGS